jgi:nucleoside-diphosphate-sugar epimerase
MKNSRFDSEMIAKFQGLRDKRILITGASGFIGSHLCRRLSEIGSELHGVSRHKQSKVNGSIQWWKGNLADLSTVKNLISAIKPDLIFHLASFVTGSRELQIVLPTFQDNLATTVNLLTAATEMGCQRIILVGSQEEPEPQDSMATPCSPYAAAKWAGSGYARMFHALYETSVSIARVFMVYGPAQQDLRKLIPYVTLSVLGNEPPKLTGGQREIDWIYVEDVIEGLLLMGQAQGIEGITVDLGSGSLVTIRTVVDKLIATIGSDVKPLYGALPERPMEQIRVADIKDTYTKIGWKAKIDLEAGLQYTVEWYKEQNIDLQ